MICLLYTAWIPSTILQKVYLGWVLVCFIQMRFFMCMHTQEVFISNNIYKKHITFFKIVVKIVLITKCNCLKRIILWKKIVCKSQKWLPPPRIKNNGPSLTYNLGENCWDIFVCIIIQSSQKFSQSRINLQNFVSSVRPFPSTPVLQINVEVLDNTNATLKRGRNSLFSAIRHWRCPIQFCQRL